MRPRARRHGAGLCRHVARVSGGGGCHSPDLPALRVPGHGSWALAGAQGRNLQRPSSPSAERSGETLRHSQKCSERSQKRSGYRRLKPEVPGERSPRWRVSCSRLVALVTQLPSAASDRGWRPRAGRGAAPLLEGDLEASPAALCLPGSAGCWLRWLQSTAQRRPEIWPPVWCAHGRDCPHLTLLFWTSQNLHRRVWSSLLAQGNWWLFSTSRQCSQGARGLTAGAGCPWGPGAANVTTDTHETPPWHCGVRSSVLALMNYYFISQEANKSLRCLGNPVLEIVKVCRAGKAIYIKGTAKDLRLNPFMAARPFVFAPA